MQGLLCGMTKYDKQLAQWAKRRVKIAAMSAKGIGPTEIARKLGITKQRVSWILRNMA